MPVGPSHSSRGGSSFSGGSSQSRSSGSSSSSSGGSSSFFGAFLGGMISGALSQRRRNRFYSNYGYYPDEKDTQSMPKRKAPNGLLFVACVLAFFLIVTICIRSGFNESIKTLSNNITIMESDAIEYEELISKAKLDNDEDNYYIATAEFGTMKYTYYDDNPTEKGAYLDFERNNISYYFIVFEYTDERDGKKYTGSTYTQFSASQLANLGGSIEVAYFSKEGAEHYAINTNYKLEDCEEYKNYKSTLASFKNTSNGFVVAIVIESILIALFIGLFIWKLKIYNKLCAQDDELLFQKKQAETNKAKAEAEVAQTEVANKNRFCKYCGCKIDPNTNICSSCGAKISK